MRATRGIRTRASGWGGGAFVGKSAPGAVDSRDAVRGTPLTFFFPLGQMAYISLAQVTPRSESIALGSPVTPSALSLVRSPTVDAAHETNSHLHL